VASVARDPASVGDREGRWRGMSRVVVMIGGISYSLPAEQVRAVLPLGNLTPVPTAPGPVLGVSQVRGQVVPVVDLSGWVAGLSGGVSGTMRSATALANPSDERVPRPGDLLLLVEVERIRLALLVDHVEPVDAGAEPLLDLHGVLAHLWQLMGVR
jgi:chemotaxis signal transduction protein